MATHKSEKYSRIMYLLSYGCTKVTRSYIMKQVKDTSPSGHNPSPWTLDDFLNHNKTLIDNTYFGSIKSTQRILFPQSGGATNIESWDLQLLCFVFLELCNPSPIVQLDYGNFKSMRNSLCHTANGLLSVSEYSAFLVQLTFGLRRCLNDIQDTDLTTEMEEAITAVETDAALQMEQFMETTLKNWHSAERAALARVEQGIGRVEEEVQHTTQTVAQNSEGIRQLTEDQQYLIKSVTALMQAQCIQIDVPETKLKLAVKNCESNNEKFICKKIIEYLKPLILHLPVDKQDEIQKAVIKAMTELLGNDIELIKAEQKCVIVHLKVQSIDSLFTLWQRCISGEMTTVFKPVEKAVQNLQGFELARIEVLLTEEEFWCCMQHIVKNLRSISSFPQLLPSSTQVRTIVQESPPPEKGSFIEMTIRPASFDHLRHITEVCKSGKLNENLKELSSVFKSKYELSHLDIEAELVSDGTIPNYEAGFEENATQNSLQPKQSTRETHAMLYGTSQRYSYTPSQSVRVSTPVNTFVNTYDLKREENKNHIKRDRDDRNERISSDYTGPHRPGSARSGESPISNHPSLHTHKRPPDISPILHLDKYLNSNEMGTSEDEDLKDENKYEEMEDEDDEEIKDSRSVKRKHSDESSLMSISKKMKIVSQRLLSLSESPPTNS